MELVTKDSELLDKFIRSSKAFYLGMGEIIMSDEEWDKVYEELGLNKDRLFELIGLEQDRNHSFPMDWSKLPKHKVRSYDEIPTDCSQSDFYDTLKYDGSSVVIYYSESGKLRGILSSSGIIQTHKLINHVPNQVTPGIYRLFAEAIVDVDKYGDTARGKANGLINSKHVQHEVDEDLKLIIYDLEYFDESLDNKGRVARLDCIGTTDKYTKAETFIKSTPNLLTPVTARVESLGITTYIDGIVRYGTENSLIYKLYYHESAVSKVNEHKLVYQPSGQIAIKLGIDHVRIEGVNVRQIAASARKVYQNGLGIGAEIEVIRSGQTIPKVSKVINRSEDIKLYCKCGTELTIHDSVGNNFKCSNLDCTELENLYTNHINWLLDNGSDFSSIVVVQALKLPAFKKYFPERFEGFNLHDFISMDDHEGLKSYLLERLPLSNNQRICFDRNLPLLFKMLKKLVQ